MLIDARGNGENIGVENDVVGWEVQFRSQQCVGALANGLAAIKSVGLPLFIEGHDDHRSTVLHALTCLV